MNKSNKFQFEIEKKWSWWEGGGGLRKKEKYTPLKQKSPFPFSLVKLVKGKKPVGKINSGGGGANL